MQRERNSGGVRRSAFVWIDWNCVYQVDWNNFDGILQFLKGEAVWKKYLKNMAE